mmetsp:Transcript_1257/g.1611  ORF Transcript_1257/g.1611 Transcript_1257/m.1611 type:complete len:236 (+) Transcript_1257:35-742(+)|eukprot:CAMPEP_0171481598 /NCGR_PEP_ID=MMETSP0946-20130122/6872_1 /TAXON_ID=109269 /ORGANISM="Vaucheria litorea, Strain CCMP2940" /LENGTH=235 /DNA_ID=CAMNT_0012013263 /DNA_START=24 /DNA_END=731 /DNA_ORIENTATION=+
MIRTRLRNLIHNNSLRALFFRPRARFTSNRTSSTKPIQIGREILGFQLDDEDLGDESESDISENEEDDEPNPDWQVSQKPMKRPQKPVLDWTTPPSDKVLDLCDRVLALNAIDLYLYLTAFKARINQYRKLEYILVYKDKTGPDYYKNKKGGKKSSEREEKKDEKTAFDVKLVGYEASSKIKVIKEVRTILGLGLKEAKEMVEAAPKMLKKDLTKDEANELVKKMKEIGAECSME